MADDPNARIDEIAAEFRELEPRDRLELLLEFAEGLPPLPDRLAAARDREEHRVHECQTPVFLWVEVEQGLVRIYADVPPESPTVRGFLGILIDALSASPVAEASRMGSDVLERLGLIALLGMTRLQGLSGILRRVRQSVAAAGAASSE